MERGEVAARNSSGGDLVEQGPGEARAGDQDLEGRRALRRVERAVVAGQRLADRRVVEEGQAAHGDRVQVADANQPLADRPQVGRPALDQGSKSRFARLEVGLVIERQPLHFLERAAVAEEHVQLAHPGAQAGIGRGVELGLEGIPGRGFPRLATAGQGVDQAARRPERETQPAVSRGELSSAFTRGRMRLDVLTQPAGDQPHDRRLAGSRDAREASARGIRVGDRDQARPDQGGQVVVGGVLGARQQGLGQLGSPSHRQPLERRGQHQPHQAGGIVASHGGELRQQVGGQDRRPARSAG